MSGRNGKAPLSFAACKKKRTRKVLLCERHLLTFRSWPWSCWGQFCLTGILPQMCHAWPRSSTTCSACWATFWPVVSLTPRSSPQVSGVVRIRQLVAGDILVRLILEDGSLLATSARFLFFIFLFFKYSVRYRTWKCEGFILDIVTMGFISDVVQQKIERALCLTILCGNFVHAVKQRAEQGPRES